MYICVWACAYARTRVRTYVYTVHSLPVWECILYIQYLWHDIVITAGRHLAWMATETQSNVRTPTGSSKQTSQNMHSLVAIHCLICGSSAENHGSGAVFGAYFRMTPWSAPTVWDCPCSSHILSISLPDGMGFRTAGSTTLLVTSAQSFLNSRLQRNAIPYPTFHHLLQEHIRRGYL